MELWPFQARCWWGPGHESGGGPGVVWCPFFPISPVPQPPVGWDELGQGQWQGRSQPGHSQMSPQAWPVSSQRSSFPSVEGWLDLNENAAPEPTGIMCTGDPGEACPWSFSLLSYFSQSLLWGCTGVLCQSTAWQLRLFPVGQNNCRYRVPSCWLTCTAWWSISDRKSSSVQEVPLTREQDTMLKCLSVLGKPWRKCVCRRINGSVHYSAAVFATITTK